jgi:hypothetical protein
MTFSRFGRHTCTTVQTSACSVAEVGGGYAQRHVRSHTCAESWRTACRVDERKYMQMHMHVHACTMCTHAHVCVCLTDCVCMDAHAAMHDLACACSCMKRTHGSLCSIVVEGVGAVLWCACIHEGVVVHMVCVSVCTPTLCVVCSVSCACVGMHACICDAGGVFHCAH